MYAHIIFLVVVLLKKHYIQMKGLYIFKFSFTCLLLALLINILKVFYPLNFQCCFALQVETDFLFPTLPLMNSDSWSKHFTQQDPRTVLFSSNQSSYSNKKLAPTVKSRTQQVKHFYILVITFPCANFQILKLVQSVVTEGCS